MSIVHFIVLVLIFCVIKHHTFQIKYLSKEMRHKMLNSNSIPYLESKNSKPLAIKTFDNIKARDQQIIIVAVACDTELHKTLDLIKSALIFTNRQLHFVILTDEYVEEISNKLSFWSEDLFDKRLIFTVKKMGPFIVNTNYLSEKFRKCGAQKLLLPSLLPQTNLVLYVKSASVFLGPVEELWSVFDKFKSTHIAAMSRDPKVDAGSILMNLQRMRRFGWENYITHIMRQWHRHVNVTGQDFMDIIFNHHQNAVMNLPCKYNYQTNLCDAQYTCQGPLFLHSSQFDKDPSYEVVSKIVRDFVIGVHTKAILSYNLKLHAANNSPCISMLGDFLETRSHSLVSKKYLIEGYNVMGKVIVVSFVVCGIRLAESLNLVKSVLFFTRQPIHFVVFAEENLKHDLEQQMSKWQGKTLFSFEMHDISLPEDARKEWLELFSKCFSQKLFIPRLLPHIDSIIYLDTDSMFLGPVEDLWKHLSRFDRYQIAGMAVDRFDLHPKFAKNAQYWNFGVNSAVILMNLTRLRQFDWTNYVTFVLPDGKLSSSWGDQVVMNIIFNEYPQALYELPCRYNYRPEHCLYGDNCPSAADGVLILHGGRGIFHRDDNHAFSVIYKAMNEYQLGTDKKLFLAKMKLYLEKVPKWLCQNLSSQFLKIPTEILLRMVFDPITKNPLSGRHSTKKPLTVPPFVEKPIEFVDVEPSIVESSLSRKNEPFINDDIIWN